MENMKINASKNNQIKNKYLNKTIGHYKIVGYIGDGGFSKVMLALEIYTKHKVALKVIDKKCLAVTELSRVRQQIAVQAHLEHPRIVKLFQVMEDQSCIYLCLEHCVGGDLFSLITLLGSFEEEFSKKLCCQMIQGIQYLHKMQIAHRDLKPQNILLTASLDIKICDFGLVTTQIDSCHQTTICGSPNYIPIQMALGCNYTPRKADIWSLGVTFYTILTSSFPFSGMDREELLEKIRECKMAQSSLLSHQAQNLIKKMLCPEKDRRTLEEIKSHYYMKSHYFNQNKIELSNLQEKNLKKQAIKKVTMLTKKSYQEVQESVNNKELNILHGLYNILFNHKSHNNSTCGSISTRSTSDGKVYQKKKQFSRKKLPRYTVDQKNLKSGKKNHSPNYRQYRIKKTGRTKSPGGEMYEQFQNKINSTFNVKEINMHVKNELKKQKNMRIKTLQNSKQQKKVKDQVRAKFYLKKLQKIMV